VRHHYYVSDLPFEMSSADFRTCPRIEIYFEDELQ